MEEYDEIVQWIAGLKAGDEEAARRIWAAYERRVAGLVRKYLPSNSGADASAVVASVFRTVFMRAKDGKFEPEGPGKAGLVHRGNLEALLFAIAFRKASKAFKAANRNPELTLDRLELLESLPDSAVLEAEVDEAFQKFVRDLNTDDPEAYQILELHRAEPDLTRPEIAKRLQIPFARVERKFSLMEERLRRELYSE